MGAADYKVVWSPQSGPQEAYVSCPVFEVCFGGSRGGGKTEGSIGDWLEHASTYGEHAVGLFVRRKLTQLEEVIARTRTIFPLLGAKYRDQKHEWTFPNGARLKFRYLERDSDADEYQGHSYTRVYVEEATNFPSPEPINKLRATLRSAVGVPVGLRLTCNPGGPGHQWVKDRYISPNKRGYEVLREKFINPFTGEEMWTERVYIPSRITDNPLLMRNDPLYIARLQQQGSAQLVKAWLEGDWDIILGAFFDCFDASKHVLSDDWLRRIPHDALRFASFDWGSAKPFSLGWYAVSDGRWDPDENGWRPPKGAIVKYREWYGMVPGKPNVGLKLHAETVARGGLNREAGERMRYRVADPAIFDRDGGPSIGERFLVEKFAFRPADNKRKVGWDQMRARLIGDGQDPMLYFLENCEDSIRTIPVLQHDEHDAEDIDTDAEDHAGDETRYACMSRPYLPRAPQFSPPTGDKLPSEATFGDLKKKHFDRMAAQREEAL
jgi:hypothetical protein